jgi:hypothetical protein
MILIVIAAIVYFGVIKPKDILPNRGLFSPQIGCVAYSLSLADFRCCWFLPRKTVRLFLNRSFYPLKGDSNYVSNVQGEMLTKVS